MIYLELFLTFLKIGAFTFGGGYAMLPLAQQEVLAHGWMTQEQVINFVAVSESTPGPFAVNMATYVGMVAGNGLLGALCATLGVILPSFIIILIVARCLTQFRKNRTVAGAMAGLRPAVVGLIGAALVSVGQTVLGAFSFAAPGFWVTVGIFILAITLIIKKVHPIVVILGSGVLGVVFGYLGLLG